jgi:hypothetical protein
MAKVDFKSKQLSCVCTCEFWVSQQQQRSRHYDRPAEVVRTKMSATITIRGLFVRPSWNVMVLRRMASLLRINRYWLGWTTRATFCHMNLTRTLSAAYKDAPPIDGALHLESQSCAGGRAWDSTTTAGAAQSRVQGTSCHNMIFSNQIVCHKQIVHCLTVVGPFAISSFQQSIRFCSLHKYLRRTY